MGKNAYTVLGKDKAFDGKEDILQIRCMAYLNIQYRNKLHFHVPNGGSRNFFEAKKLKDMGVLAGVADILILNKCGGYSGLVVELKRKGGNIRDNQKDFLNKAAAEGFKVAVVYNFDAFKDLVDWYFKLN